MTVRSARASDLPVRLLAERRSRHLTQAEAAALLGISLRHYQRWERGTSTPRRRELERIAECLDSPRRDYGREIDAIQREIERLREEVLGMRGVAANGAAGARH